MEEDTMANVFKKWTVTKTENFPKRNAGPPEKRIARSGKSVCAKSSTKTEMENSPKRKRKKCAKPCVNGIC